MNLMETFQGQLEVTRRYIINQLDEEITHLQREIEKTAGNDRKVSHTWEHRIYRKVIAHKRRLIDRLS